MWKFLKSNATREDIAVTLEAIIRGTDYVWGDFTDIILRDQTLDALRVKVLALETSHPPGPDDNDVNPEGQEIIRGYIRELREGGNSWLSGAEA